MALLDLFNMKYPSTDFHELNLDWCISAVLQLQKAFEDFSAGNTLTFAEPLQHDLTKTYAKNTIVIDASGTAYLSLQAVPKGVQLANASYWLPVFDFAGYITRANQNFTDNYFSGTDRTPIALSVGDWVVLDDVLYKVTVAMDADDLFIIDTNIVHFTVEQFLKDFTTSIVQTVNQYKADIDASELLYRQQLAQDIANTTASLQAQLDAAIAGATVDSEVINARIGADGVTYDTLGNAIRTQLSDDDDLLGVTNHNNLALSNGTPQNSGNLYAVHTTNFINVTQPCIIDIYTNRPVDAGYNYIFWLYIYDSNDTLVQTYADAGVDVHRFKIDRPKWKKVKYAITQYDGNNYEPLRTTDFTGYKVHAAEWSLGADERFNYAENFHAYIGSGGKFTFAYKNGVVAGKFAWRITGGLNLIAPLSGITKNFTLADIITAVGASNVYTDEFGVDWVCIAAGYALAYNADTEQLVVYPINTSKKTPLNTYILITFWSLQAIDGFLYPKFLYDLYDHLNMTPVKKQIGDIEEQIGVYAYPNLAVKNGTPQNSGNTLAVCLNTPIDIKAPCIVELITDRPNTSGYHYLYGLYGLDSADNFIFTRGYSDPSADTKPYKVINANIVKFTFSIVESDGNGNYNPLRTTNFNDYLVRVVVHELPDVEALYNTDEYIKNRWAVAFNADSKFLYFSDIHNRRVNAKRIMDYANAHSGEIDAILDGGDNVARYLNDGEYNFSWYADMISDSNIDILSAVGNHDSWDGAYFNNADPVDVYNAIIAPIAAKFNINQPTGASANGYCYYYKDYNDVRVIVLDAMTTFSAWDATQSTWLTNTLADARSNSKSVIIVTHAWFDPDDVTILNDADNWTSWRYNLTTDGIYSENAILSIVNNFITAGGDFICYLTGHTHYDIIAKDNTYNQLILTIATAGHDMHNDGSNTDDISNSSYDCFDYLGIDTTNKIVKFTRIGWDVDGSMKVRNNLGIKYDTCEVLGH